MKTIHMRHLLPLAAIALIAAACDPFPAKPGGDPRIVRVITTDQDSTGNIVTKENTGTSAGTVAVTGAYPGDKIIIQFNKPMKGSTLQKYVDRDPTIPLDDTSVGVRTSPLAPGYPNAKPPIPPTPAFTDPGKELSACTKPDNLTLTGFVETTAEPGIWDPVAQDFSSGGVYAAYTSVCYVPQSVTDGAQLVIKPAVGMELGTTYRIQGTVQDYEGKSLAIDVSVTVSDVPVATIGDTLRAPGLGNAYYYGAFLNWFPTPGVLAGTYRAQIALDDGSGTPPGVTSTAWTVQPEKTGAAVSCAEATDPGGAGLGYKACQASWGELDPNRFDADHNPVDENGAPAALQTYWFRVSADGGTTWTVSDGTTDIRGPFTPTLLNFADPLTVPPVNLPGAVQIPWARYLGTGVANSAATFPKPGATVPAQPADMPDFMYPFSGATLTSDKTVIVERFVSTFDADGAPVKPAANAAGWVDITSTMQSIDNVVTNLFYQDLFSPYGVTITPPFAKLNRVGVDKTAVSGTGYWYRVRPNYASGKVINGVPKYKKAL